MSARGPGSWEKQPDVPCPACGSAFPYLVPCSDGQDRCSDCSRALDRAQQVAAEGAQLLARLEDVVADALVRSGLAPRERRSSLEGATRKILEAIPVASGAAFRAGMASARGIGLSGPAGIGKTGALAALVRVGLRRRLELELPRLGAGALRPWLSWLSWPETVNRLRVTAARDGGVIEAEQFIEAASSVDVLVLDDLGAERIRGSYIDDWAASQLDLVVDGRYRNDRRTWFTTTLGRDELVLKYGQRLFSRLSCENDLVLLPRLTDRRLLPGATGGS